MPIRKLNNNIEDKKLLVDYLQLVDKDFMPNLSQKTDLVLFSTKILSLGDACIYIEEGQICGLITYYANDFIDKRSYCSLLSIMDSKRGRGIASILLDEFIANSKAAGMMYATVHTNNVLALNMYLKKGFEIKSVDKVTGSQRFFLKKKL